MVFLKQLTGAHQPKGVHRSSRSRLETKMVWAIVQLWQHSAKMVRVRVSITLPIVPDRRVKVLCSRVERCIKGKLFTGELIVEAGRRDPTQHWRSTGCVLKSVVQLQLEGVYPCKVEQNGRQEGYGSFQR
jgi:hypothetical protein